MKRDWKKFVRSRLDSPIPDPATEAEVVDELAHDLEDRYFQALRHGRSEEKAFELAAAALGDLRLLQSELRHRQKRSRVPAPPPSAPAHWLRDLCQDLEYAVRLLWHRPGFSFLIIAILALGIAAGTSIYTVVNAILLKPLPFSAAEQIVLTGHQNTDGSAGNLGFATLQDWRDQSQSFSELALFRLWAPTLMDEQGAERIPAMRVSSNFFSLLGVPLALGRDFEPAEDRPEQWRVVIISDRLWKQRFGGDPSVVGTSIQMNDQSYSIVGVLPSTYEPILSSHFYQRAEMWAPLGYDISLPYACRSCQHLKALGRLREGVSVEQARQDLNAIQDRLRAAYPAEYSDEPVAVTALEEELTRPVLPALQILSGAVLLVLLIGCANVANLLLARGSERGREIALRSALGAGGTRLLRQLLTESLLLALAGGTVGLVASFAGVRALTGLAPASVHRLDQISVDTGVVAFALGLSVITGILFGILPALQASRPDLVPALRQDGRTTAGRGTRRTQHLLVVANVALALVLLTGCGLMLQTVAHLLRVDPGFEAENLLTFQISLVGDRYSEAERERATVAEILAGVAGLPGVRGVAATSQVPLGGNGDRWGFHVEGRQSANPADDPSVERYGVTPGYLQVMGIPLLKGRFFSDQDRADAVSVLVVGERTARQLWGGEDPVGRRVNVGDVWRTVIGITGDVRHRNLDSLPDLQMYTPYAQVLDSFLTIVVRTSGDPLAVADSVRGVVRKTAADVPVYNLASMDHLLRQATADRQFVMVLLTIFACLAILLAAAGIYAVVSYRVVQRTQELGIRQAMGAGPVHITRIVFWIGLRLTAVGLVMGALLCLILTPFLRTLLFEVQATDPWILLAATVILTIVATLAHLWPLRRALRVDPVIALRSE